MEKKKVNIYLRAMKDLVGFHTSIQHSTHHSITSPDIRAKPVLSTEHAFEHIFWHC